MPKPSESEAPEKRVRKQIDLGERIARAVETISRREVALASFEGLRAQYALLMEAYRELRTEHDQLLADLRGTRSELRSAVRGYARELRRQGVPSDEIGIALKGVIDRILEPTPAGIADALSREVVAWGEESYAMADPADDAPGRRPPGRGPRDEARRGDR